MSDCLFCKIANGKTDTKLVYENDNLAAFTDINPKAPVHILIIPKKHISSLAETQSADFNLIGNLLQVAQKLAVQEKIDRSGYRVVLNNGKAAGQAVEHIHFHLLGGRDFTWPPG